MCAVFSPEALHFPSPVVLAAVAGGCVAHKRVNERYSVDVDHVGVLSTEAIPIWGTKSWRRDVTGGEDDVDARGVQW